MKVGSKVLVAGGSGFLGSNLIRRLVDSRLEIRATYHSKPPSFVNQRVESLRADLTEWSSCEAVVRGVDYVFMCAASTSGAAAIASTPLVHVTPNVVMNSRMLEAAYSEGVKKFIWISSSVGYPPSGKRPVVEDEFFDGDPPEVYFASGWMKRYTEILGRMYSEKLERRMPVVVLRPSNIYGPHDKFDLGSSHVTAALIRKVVERQDPVTVWGTGKDIRDLIYVDDFIDAMLLAVDKIDVFNPLNVASGVCYTVDEILDKILRIARYRGAVVKHDLSRPSMIPMRFISTKKAEKVLGFRARTTLEEGLRRTIKWYRESVSPKRAKSAA